MGSEREVGGAEADACADSAVRSNRRMGASLRCCVAFSPSSRQVAGAPRHQQSAHGVALGADLAGALRTPQRWALLAACFLWLALVSSPALVTAFEWRTELGWLPDLLRWLLQPICHQLPARSPHLFGESLAACHRCMGLYLGFTLGVATWPLLPALAHRLAANPRCVVVCFIPLGIDWALLENTAMSRFATGVVASFPVALLALIAIAQRGTGTSAIGQRATKKKRMY